MNWFKRRRIEEKALRVCDGVIEVANNEMLVRGQYISEEIANERLAVEGAICGGHNACLIGSMYLAHGDAPNWDEVDHSQRNWGGIFSVYRDDWIGARPALKLAYNAFNQAAKTIVDENYSEWSNYQDRDMTPYRGWAEFFFERVLDVQLDEVTGEVIQVAENAKVLIRNREVVA